MAERGQAEYPHSHDSLANLKEAADILGLSIFMITDDYASFFNQLRLSKSEYPKTGAMHPPRTGQEQASFAYDTALGFGIKMASNVAKDSQTS